jgi:hypothetical protein
MNSSACAIRSSALVPLGLAKNMVAIESSPRLRETMPYPQVDLQNEKGNQYALAALKRKRGDMAGEIQRMKGMLAYRQEQLAHLDASIKLLDPDFPVETIPPKRPRQVKLFRHGELGRTIMDALRKAEGISLPVSEIVNALIEDKGYGQGARPALSHRVRANLAYLSRRGMVTKSGDRETARWALAIGSSR